MPTPTSPFKTQISFFADADLHDALMRRSRVAGVPMAELIRRDLSAASGLMSDGEADALAARRALETVLASAESASAEASRLRAENESLRARPERGGEPTPRCGADAPAPFWS